MRRLIIASLLLISVGSVTPNRTYSPKPSSFKVPTASERIDRTMYRLRDRVPLSYMKVIKPKMMAMIDVESEFHPNAVSKSGKYHGILQIGQVMLDEYHRLTGKKYYLKDVKKPEVSIEIFMVVQYMKNPKNSTVRMLKIWNAPNYTSYSKKYHKSIKKSFHAKYFV